MSKQLFDQLLSDLEESEPSGTPGSPRNLPAPPPNPPPDAFFAAIKTEDKNPLLLTRQFGFCTRDDVLRVMNSSIFYEGGLRGSPLRGKEGAYKVWPIKDLAYFILETTTCLVMPEWEEIMQGTISAFDTAIGQIDRLERASRAYDSTRSMKKLGRIREELNKIKSHLTSKKFPPLPAELRKRQDRVDNLIQLFMEQIPDAPGDTIAKSISTLLKEFLDQTMESNSIRQRMYRIKLR